MSSLQRVVGVPGAILLGLGSILGTGVYVSLNLAVQVAGSAALLAVGAAGILALCNGLSSAQLASAHPVSGGTYEYGYRYLNPQLGFCAGWLFLCAKSASAASAALGFSYYLLPSASRLTHIGIASATTLLVSSLVAHGIKRSNWANALLVTITLSALLALIAGGLCTSQAATPAAQLAPSLPGFLEACALVFVAFTGYGRLATLGEEIREPRRSIPRAIFFTLSLSIAIYLGVVHLIVREGGASPAVAQNVTLVQIARQLRIVGLPSLVRVGAATALLGVLLNLLLGLSRVSLAMARRGDLPTGLAQLSGTQSSPTRAVWFVASTITVLCFLGDIKLTWSFSAFTVLLYYALTNCAALRMSPMERQYPRFIAWLGLAGCAGLAFWVQSSVWLAGLAWLALGLLLRSLFRKPPTQPE